MKPRFALDMSNDAIGLLERRAEGWAKIGAADLTDPRLDRRLAILRSAAEARAPEGFCTKLILPNSQILYLAIDAPGPDTQSRRAQIRAALDGRTPYTVDELVFDWSGSGPSVRVAVLARETLQEAEEFAEAYGFRPAAFVAIPDDGRFGGEPFFGLTDVAVRHLPAGARFDRDQDPVRIVEDTSEADPRTEGAGTEGAGTALADGAVDAEAAIDAPPPEEADEAGPDWSEPASDGAALELADEPSAWVGEPAVGDDLAVSEAASSPGEVEPDVATDEPEASAPAEVAADADPGFVAAEEIAEEDDEAERGNAAPALAGADAAADAAADPDAEAPFVAIEDEETAPAAVPEPIAAADDLVEDQAPDDADDAAVDAPPPLAVQAFQSRRSPGQSGQEGARLAEITRRLGGLGGATAETRDERHRIQVTDARPVGRRGDDRASVPAGSAMRRIGAVAVEFRARAQGAAAAARRAGADGLNRLGERLPRQDGGNARGAGRTVFGAPLAGRSDRRRLAIGAAIAAALVLVTIALWSLVFSAGRDPDPQTANTPGAIAPAAPAQDSDLAAAVPDAPPAAPEAEPELAVPGVVTSAPRPLGGADADVATTVAPAAAEPLPAPAEPGLPPGETLAGDAPLPSQPLPQPFGTTFTYDTDGLIEPTAEGVVTPGGFTLVAGRPARVPPARPIAPESAAAAEPAQPEPLPGNAPATAPGEAAPAVASTMGPVPPPADPRHAALKPKSRPDSIAAAAEAARENAARVADAAEAAARAEAEAFEAALQGATAQAVASSRRPASRPAEIATIAANAKAAAQPAPVEAAAVEAALAEAQAAAPAEPQPETQTAAAAPEPPPAELDEPEPQQGIATMPTTRTVAKKSTIANAIDLGDINLIGVYGSSANRRALVRMPNGRYVKVQVGDRLDGGKVAAIGDNQLSYVKKGRTIVLKMLKDS